MIPRQLTLVITTFNRIERLKKCLTLAMQEIEKLPRPTVVELLVVNNASADGTKEYLDGLPQDKIRVIHNSFNQGMLGNLNICALNATGKYVWCLGDDDLIFDGAIQEVLQVIENYEIPLIYLNYAHISPGEHDNSFNTYKNIPCNLSESGVYSLQSALQANGNLMTAIYALVLRRDHAIYCYSVMTDAAPFTTLESCVPTTCYALSLEPLTPTYWISKPLLAVDLRVSWLNYAPIWILERFPEMMLRFIDWSNNEMNLDYIYHEMKDGIKHWLAQPKDTFVHPSTYVFLIAITKKYGNESDLDQIIEHIGIPEFP